MGTTQGRRIQAALVNGENIQEQKKIMPYTTRRESMITEEEKGTNRMSLIFTECQKACRFLKKKQME